MTGHAHRSTLSQSNKPFKGHGMNQKNAPKVSGSKVTSLGKDMNRTERMNLSKQLREGKVANILPQKMLGKQQPPKMVALLSFHPTVNSTDMKKIICKQLLDEQEMSEIVTNGPTTLMLPPWAHPSNNKELKKQRISLIDVPRDFNAAMDIVKAVDVIVFCFGAASIESPAFDEPGYRLLSALKLQGLPTVIGAVAPASSFGVTNAKQIRENTDFTQRFFISELGVDKKFFALESEMDTKNFIRALSGLTPKMVGFRMNRGYMMGQQWAYNEETQQLKISGFARGVGFSCKHPVHVTGVGDAVLTKIEIGQDPCPSIKIHKFSDNSMDLENFVLDELREDNITQLTESWRNLLPFNPLEGEQTYLSNKITADGNEEVLDESILIEDTMSAGRQLNSKVKSNSKSAPSYQNTADEDDVMDVEENMDDEDGIDDDELLKGILGEGGEITDDFDGLEHAAAEKRRMRDQLTVRAEEEMQFPDERDTPLDQAAKDRFMKYRGLSSFKQATWDPYQDLPNSYSRIFEFESFKATSKVSIKEFIADCEHIDASGRYVILTLELITPDMLKKHSGPMIVSSLLNIERKVSVQQFRFSRILPFEEPVRSKDLVQISAGFRRFPSKPLYSSIPAKTQGSFECKSRFRRFFQLDGQDYFAHCFAPAIVSPCSALLFKTDIAGVENHLVAWGSVETPDPTSVCLKRILLTGYPFRVHKKKVVVRFMFFNAADVKYFKPVQLQTKRGVSGHIIESVGTHGYYKARFAGRITHADTVCMPLYKRVYPVWYGPTWGVEETSVHDCEDSGTLEGRVTVTAAVDTGDQW